jgi:hypothetical protein
MPFWLWLLSGLIAGVAPTLLARPPLRPLFARRWWWLLFAFVATCIIIPCGVVLLMFLSESAFDAIREMGQFFLSDDFGWFTALTLGCLTGSGAMAWSYRQAPCLQGPPPSERVTALADDPDKQWHAIQTYRQETGVGIAVATDVVEAYIASRRQRPPAAGADARQLGALEWMYMGFGTVWYGVLAAGYALTFRSQSNHFITGLAVFLFIPGLFSGFCGLCARAVSTRTGAVLKTAFQSAVLTRRYAFLAGLVAGAASILGVLGVAWGIYSWRHDETGVLVGLGGIGAVLTSAPFLGRWLLGKKTARA